MLFQHKAPPPRAKTKDFAHLAALEANPLLVLVILIFWKIMVFWRFVQVKHRDFP